MPAASDFFSNYLPTKIKDNPGLAQEVNATYQFEIAGLGDYLVCLKSDGAGVSEGRGDADCTVSISKDDFEKLLGNPASGMMMFTMGKLKVTNIGLGMALQKILG